MKTKMAHFVVIATALITFQVASSYILFTANLEDVQALAKQLAASPVADQLNKMWRRAATQFNQQLAKDNKNNNRYQHKRYMKRTNAEESREKDQQPYEDEQQQPMAGDPYRQLPERENQIERRNGPTLNQDDADVVALGKNASQYLKSIRKIFENN